MRCGFRFLCIMGQIPTAREAIGLNELAQLLRHSAAETDDENYIGLFLSAAMALEARALASSTPFSELSRHMSRS